MGILIAAIALAAAQSAADPAPPASEHRLTPERIETVLAEAAAKRQASEQRAATTMEIADLEPLPPPQLHGEFGISAGTGGYREIFGTGVYPMGTDGVAAFSFDFVDFGNRSYRRNRY
ncbi:hypothetical protein LZ496_10250 [Sphingomonas sp. NSE70-1]|uniref:Uncharacterized protein n=1 Tax=Sphingomonas caseinilyticus TaxID=2908205 RepID=A0ABT0RWE9_9SPHN|nr:hypothetical protein [Sphingomonas caseinilyticus]MCL6699158.1 hypothetical protein [Sphingomonas caseinilyticus]